MQSSAERAKTLEAVVRLRGHKINKMFNDIEQIKRDVAAIKKHLGL
jgi:hypothetical protein